MNERWFDFVLLLLCLLFGLSVATIGLEFGWTVVVTGFVFGSVLIAAASPLFSESFILNRVP